MEVKEIIDFFEQRIDKKNLEGMARFAINSGRSYGVRIPVIRQLAKELKKNHDLAIVLWDHPYRETRILAGLIADPKQFTEEDANNWVKEFDDWELCDQSCFNLFHKLEYANDLVYQWVESDQEFIRRAGFSLVAKLAIVQKKRDDEEFIQFLKLAEKHSKDPRNFVKKAVNWAIRQIGKRSNYLNGIAAELSKNLYESSDKTAQWIGRDAYKELTDQKILKRIKR